MADFILVDGDIVTFLPNFNPAIVAVQPGKLTGSGKITIQNKKVCIEGDEKNVSVTGCNYVTPIHSIPGTGTLKIEALATDQKARKSICDGKAILLKGGLFTAKFEVQSPAQQPPPGPGAPIPDSTSSYTGTGMF